MSKERGFKLADFSRVNCKIPIECVKFIYDSQDRPADFARNAIAEKLKNFNPLTKIPIYKGSNLKFFSLQIDKKICEKIRLTDFSLARFISWAIVEKIKSLGGTVSYQVAEIKTGDDQTDHVIKELLKISDQLEELNTTAIYISGLGDNADLYFTKVFNSIAALIDFLELQQARKKLIS